MSDEFREPSREIKAKDAQDAGKPVGEGAVAQAGTSVLPAVPPWMDDCDDPLVCDDQTLAQFHYEPGTHVLFTYDRYSGDYGVQEESLLGEGGPLVLGDMDSILALFLAITPCSVPVPQLLRAEPEKGLDLSELLTGREFSEEPVIVDELDFALPRVPPHGIHTCPAGLHHELPWSHWLETGALPAKTYYSSNFAGKMRYTQSVIGNCIPVGYPSHLWVRHRIAYKEGKKWFKQLDEKAAPGKKKSSIKGSIKRYRRVSYDTSWGQSPNYWYGRTGRFRNSKKG
jgi:hypothetical protein